MKKTARYSVTVLLVFVMLFALLLPSAAATATEIGAASLSAASAPESVVGSNDVGWIKVVYTDESISVVLRPDTEELKAISLAEVRSIVGTLLEAIGEVVLEDIKDQFIGSEYGDDFKDITVTDAFELALDKYITDGEYEGATEDEKYLNFLKAALADDDNSVIADFAAYVSGLLRDVVKAGFIAKDDLISKDEVEKKLEAIFNEELDARISARVEAYMDEYFKWIETTDYTPNIEASVLAHVNALTVG